MRDDCSRTMVVMDTLVTIQMPRTGASLFDAAFQWFHQIETCCSRFDPASELMQATSQIGVAVPISTMLFHAVEFALTVAEQSGGAFDPTVGDAMERRGFNREHRSGRRLTTPIARDTDVSFRDVSLDRDRRTMTVRRPMILDLGAVAKGLAIDMAAHELRPLGSFAIDAGGDLYLAGCRPDGHRWSVGIRAPRRGPLADTGELEAVEVLHVSDLAVCTSGDYARPAPDGGGHHIVDPRTGGSAHEVASVTVLAPRAMLADAVATAVFVLGPQDGIRLCEQLDVDALVVTPASECFSTQRMRSGHYRRGEAFLPDTQGAGHDRPADPGRDRGAAGGT